MKYFRNSLIITQTFVAGFDSVDEVIDLVTMVISTCSLAHATSFLQYEQYGYVPNYPGILRATIPTEKVRFNIN